MASGFLGQIAAGATLSVTVESTAKVIVSAAGAGSFQIATVTALTFSAAGSQTIYVAPGTYTFGATTAAMSISILEE